MEKPYRIFGAELSPYSVKVRSYFRYKRLPHEWVPRTAANQAEFDRYAKLPLIPLVVTPDGEGLQDSTLIIEYFEQRLSEPSIHPSDSCLRFLSALVEEYADEWGNKPMFHYRWFYEADANVAARRIATAMMPNLSAGDLPGAIEMVKGRMVPRLKLVGSSAQTKEIIEGSFRRQLFLLEAHLDGRRYLFGGRPALADLGLFAQLYECSIDPTPGAIMRAGSPRVLQWIERMLEPRDEGPFEEWSTLAPTLLPLLREEIGAIFFPWTLANEAALERGEKELSVVLDGVRYTQEVQKYHAKSLRALRQRYAAVMDRSALDPVLGAANCLEPLRGGVTP